MVVEFSAARAGDLPDAEQQTGETRHASAG